MAFDFHKCVPQVIQSGFYKHAIGPSIIFNSFPIRSASQKKKEKKRRCGEITTDIYFWSKSFLARKLWNVTAVQKLETQTDNHHWDEPAWIVQLTLHRRLRTSTIVILSVLWVNWLLYIDVIHLCTLEIITGSVSAARAADDAVLSFQRLIFETCKELCCKQLYLDLLSKETFGNGTNCPF